MAGLLSDVDVQQMQVLERRLPHPFQRNPAGSWPRISVFAVDLPFSTLIDD